MVPVSVRQKGIEKEQAGTDYDAGIGHVEVRKVIAGDVHFNEVDDRTVRYAVMDIAQCAAEDKREGDGGEADAITETNEGNEYDQCSQRCEADQPPSDKLGRGGIGED